MGLSCQAEIEERLRRAVAQYVAPLLPQTTCGAVATSWTRQAAESRVDNFGCVGTRLLFQTLGVAEPLDDFLVRAGARFAAEAASELQAGPTPFRVFAYAECDLVHPRPLAATLFRMNGVGGPGACHPRWLHPAPLPINAFVDRELCAEFQLLEAACELLATTVRAGDASTRSEVAGTLSVLVSGACCLSCVAAVRQFQLLWPRLVIAIGIAPRVGALPPRARKLGALSS